MSLSKLSEVRDTQFAERLVRAEQNWKWLTEKVFSGTPESEEQNVKLLLCDCMEWLGHVAAVYVEVTGGQVCDALENPNVVIAAYRRHVLNMLNVASKTQQ